MTVQSESYGNGKPRLVQRLGIVPFLCYLTAVAMLHALYYCPEQVLTLCNLLAYAWGGLLGVALLIQERPYRPTHRAFPLFVLVMGFLLAYLMTVLVNPQKVENLKGLASMGIQLVVVFFYLSTLDRKQSKRLLTLLSALVVAMTFLASAISLTLYVIDRIPPVMENRFAGIYINPNTTVVGLLSLFLSVFFFMAGRRWLRWFHGLNILVQLLVTIFSASRAVRVVTYVFLILLSVYCFFMRKQYNPRWALLTAIFVLIGGFISVMGIQAAAPYLQIHPTVQETSVASSPLKDQASLPPFSPMPTDNGSITSRPAEESEASSAIRLQMIRGGLRTLSRHPILGVGVRNIPTIVRAENADLNLFGIENGGLHNSYLQLLVANGLLGFLFMVSLALYSCKVILVWNQKKDPAIWFFFLYLVCICAHGMFEVSFLFSNSITALTFWASLGFLMSQSTGSSDYPQLLHSVPQREEDAA